MFSVERLFRLVSEDHIFFRGTELLCFFDEDSLYYSTVVILVSSFCPFVDEREYCYRKLLNYSVSKEYFKSFENLHVDFLFDVDQKKSPMITEISRFYSK